MTLKELIVNNNNNNNNKIYLLLLKWIKNIENVNEKS